MSAPIKTAKFSARKQNQDENHEINHFNFGVIKVE